MQPLRSFEAALSSFRLSSGSGAPGTQEDAEEWLGFLLDQMHEELLVSGPLPPPSVAEAEASDASPITCIFGGRLESRLESRGGAPGAKQNKPSITIEHFRCLKVDIESSGVVSLEDAITGLCSPEWIDGVEMEKGQPAVRAQRQYLIRHPPPVLILHLKRFSHDARGAHKLSKPLKFSESLTLKSTVLAPVAPSCASNGAKPVAPTYRLFAGGRVLPQLTQQRPHHTHIDSSFFSPPPPPPPPNPPPPPLQSSRTTARRCAAATTRAMSGAHRALPPTPTQRPSGSIAATSRCAACR